MDNAPAKIVTVPPDPHCPGCDYNLRGIASDKCPECGLAIDDSQSALSRLPWSHRKQIGRVRAYCRTNLIAIIRPKRLAEEITRPVSYADAQAFRRVTVLLAWLPIAIWLGIALVAIVSDLIGRYVRYHELAGFPDLLVFIAFVLGTFLLLYLGSGVASYFFHPRAIPIVRQNRGIALSYYSFAPFAWIGVPSGLIALFQLIDVSPLRASRFAEGLQVACAIAASLISAGIVLLYAIRVTGLMKRVTETGKLRSAGMAVGLLIGWAGAFAIAFLPAAVLAYVLLVLLSFR